MERRLVGLPGSGAKAYLARALSSGKGLPPGLDLTWGSGPEVKQVRLVVVAADQEEAEDVADGWQALAPLLGEPHAPAALFGEDERGRLASLEQLKQGARLIVCTPESLGQPLPLPQDFGKQTVSLRVNDTLSREHLLQRLADAGYQRVDYVESPGEFAARGAVVDFYGLEPLQAVRVLFDEDRVASMRTFEPTTQETLAFVGEAKAVPAGQAENAAVGRLADWLGPATAWLAPEGIELDLPEGARVWRAAVGAQDEDLDFGAAPNPPCRGDYSRAWKEMRELAEKGFRVVLFSLNRGEDTRVQELLEERLEPGQAQFVIGPLRQGFRHEGLKLAVFATSEIFERRYRRAAGWKYFTTSYKGALRWRELRQGDYVVHQDYGVSRYQGLKPVESPGHGTLDCLLLEFRGADRLYIPMNEFGRVQKYSGSEGKRPRLSSLDTRKWEEIKRQVSEGVRELAEQLLKTQAQRAARPGFGFPDETPMEREFAEAFPYEETPDQAAAIRDVLNDMMSPHPMDRVVIGDVGFGKTEVAMRAAFKCVAGFKQCAVLVPTTILADQHYRTFSQRMADYPVRLGLLTRFQTKAQQKAVVEALKEGKLDIVVATARLLQKDVAFKDLGLIVVDEEHRFGVKDKERLKSFRATVDVLSLSATPIPRTLNQALSGLRGISLIQSAPQGRQPIVTKVGPWNEDVVAAAISEELSRGGQVYYVHNRVRSMTDTIKRLQTLMPQVRFGMVHGQMKGHEIEDVMWRFFNREFDVLIASTIIESGLDIPAVNTLLVEDAHEFGLAQLYQLRGRVGRERQRAYCYLFFHEGYEDMSVLSEDARKRLDALKEFGALGAGIKLAMRDLEIRGAGELLGARQHGFMNAVGVEFYTQMLNDEVARRQGKARPDAGRDDLQLDLAMPAFLPESYLPDELRRLDFYKKMLRAGPGEVDALKKEIEDLCGPAPEPVLNLLKLVRVRAAARQAGVKSVLQRKQELTIYFRQDAPIDPAKLSWWTSQYKGRLQFVRGVDADGVQVTLDGEEPLRWLEDFLTASAKGR